MARPRLTWVFAVGGFRVLWVTEVLSVLGDQVARMALKVLVYCRTGSGTLALVAAAWWGVVRDGSQAGPSCT